MTINELDETQLFHAYSRPLTIQGFIIGKVDQGGW